MFVEFDLITVLWTVFNTALLAAIAFIAEHYIGKKRKTKKDEKSS